MKEFEFKKIELMQHVSVYWKAACEHSNDATYQEVINIMENVIFSETAEQLEKAGNRLSKVIPDIELSIANTGRLIQKSWENRRGRLGHD